jgi:hypothetical protein
LLIEIDRTQAGSSLRLDLPLDTGFAIEIDHLSPLG